MRSSMPAMSEHAQEVGVPSLSGFADEAARDAAGQIAATRALGWTRIEARGVDGVNVHDLNDDAFARFSDAITAAGITVDCLGSAIGNGRKRIEDDPEQHRGEARRAIARAAHLGCAQIRVMSWPPCKGRPSEEQQLAERVRRLRELQRMFADAGIAMLHENCHNYGGLGASYTLRLLAEVPGMRLVFDTGNPVHSEDWDRPAGADGTRPRQRSWDFYRQVREHIARVHIKDGDRARDGGHAWPGEGQGDVRAVVRDLLARGYTGTFSIEPHLPSGDPAAMYVEYGRRFERLLAEARASIAGEAARGG